VKTARAVFSPRYSTKDETRMTRATISRPRLFQTLLCTGALIFAAGTPAMAQMTQAPRFIPSGWEVGASQLAGMQGLDGMKLPCIISTTYDNGYVVRFSGGGEQFLALAVDFRQGIFEQGRKYNAMLSIDDAYMKQVVATAFAPGILIFNLRPHADLYNAVKNGRQMELTVEGNRLGFSLQDIAGAYPSFEKCYTGGNVAPMSPPQNPRGPKDALVREEGPHGLRRVQVPGVRNAQAAPPLPRSMNDIVQQSDAAQSAPVPIIPVTPSQWTARAGEDLRDVLGRWGSRAGYDVQWDAQQSGAIMQDVSYSGSFEEAAAQLLAENGAATGLSGKIQDDYGTKQLIAAKNNAASNPAWTAAPGANLRSTITGWASRAGVSVLWRAPEDLKVKNALPASENFESAVQGVLDQYQNDSRRPVGRLNTDPQTGQRTLTIELDTTA
jgi:hypothetical protein